MLSWGSGDLQHKADSCTCPRKCPDPGYACEGCTRDSNHGYKTPEERDACEVHCCCLSLPLHCLSLPFHCLSFDLSLPFVDLSLPFVDLSLPFVDLSLPFVDLSLTIR